MASQVDDVMALPDDLSLSPDTRVAKPRRACPAESVRPTRAEVNLAHLRHNLRVLERALSVPVGSPPPSGPLSQGARGAPVWGVLKADGYGHGAPAVARTLERAGVTGICVALLEEGIELREAGIRAPILVMGGYYGRDRQGLVEAVERHLTPVIYDVGQIETLVHVAKERGAPVDVHLKVDTGMSRLGASRTSIASILQSLAAHPEVRLDGLMTHLACADADDLESTRDQLAELDTVDAEVRSAGLTPRVRHAANSAALLRLDEARLDLVRPGIALFGVAPRGDLELDLRPVMKVRSEIVALRTLRKGDSVGYGHTFTATRATQIATVPIGYADGLNRSLSNRGHALVRGQRAPMVGVMSMDLTTVDVTDIPGVRLGDEMVFLGAQEGPLGSDVINAEELAAATDTIPWEILTSVSRRVPRFYREP